MTRERATFLSDIIIGAVEGGTGYWAKVSQYQYVDENGAVRVYCGEKQPEGTRATLHEVDGGGPLNVLTLTTDVVARGVGEIAKGRVELNADLLEAIRRADRENDAGEIDAEAYDAIVQVGLFGDVVYG